MKSLSSIRTPQLRIAVSARCNLHCVYCRPEGEGYPDQPNVLLPAKVILQIARLAADEGITHVKVTGGEPLLREDIEHIVEGLKGIPSLQDVQLVTNATMLAHRARSLKNAGLDLLTVSLDAASDRMLQSIRGISISLIRKALAECSSCSLPLRINSVIMRSNFNEITGLITLAREYGASLKLLDLIDLNPGSDSAFWLKEFVDLRVLDQFFEKDAIQVGFEKAPGGIGASLHRFILRNGLEVVIKQSSRGGFYYDTCYECPFFPCQDALISIRITHNGLIKKCLIRNDNLIDIITPLLAADSHEASARFREVFQVLCNSRFHNEAWWNTLNRGGWRR